MQLTSVYSSVLPDELLQVPAAAVVGWFVRSTWSTERDEEPPVSKSNADAVIMCVQK